MEVDNSHYDNSKGSLYKFAEDQKLNSYEFDLIKRIVRCRKKGKFKQDLEKSKILIDLYIKETEEKTVLEDSWEIIKHRIVNLPTELINPYRDLKFDEA